jgi:hypothetical protein
MEHEPSGRIKESEIVAAAKGLAENPPKPNLFQKYVEKESKLVMEVIIKKVEGQVSSGAPLS